MIGLSTVNRLSNSRSVDPCGCSLTGCILKRSTTLTNRSLRSGRCSRKIAVAAGLHYVYEGNIHSDAAHTFCPGCGEIVVRRSWHDVRENRLRDGACPSCGLPIPGLWTSAAAEEKSAGKFSRNLADKYADLNL